MPSMYHSGGQYFEYGTDRSEVRQINRLIAMGPMMRRCPPIPDPLCRLSVNFALDRYVHMFPWSEQKLIDAHDALANEAGSKSDSRRYEASLFSPCVEHIDDVIQTEGTLSAIGAQRVWGRSQTRGHRRSHVRPHNQGPQRKLLSTDREKNSAGGWERPQNLPFASQPKISELNGAIKSWWAWSVQLRARVNHPVSTPRVLSRCKVVKKTIDAPSQLLVVMRDGLMHIGDR